MLGKPAGRILEWEFRIAGVWERMNEDHDRWADHWREGRVDEERRGVGRRGDMGVQYRNDSQAEVPDRLPSLTAGTQRLPTYCKLH